MDLVDKEHRAAAVDKFLAGVRDDLPHLLDAGIQGRQTDEVVSQGLGNQGSNRGLARTGRAVQNDGRFARTLNKPAQRLAGLQQVLLAYDFLEGLRPHPCRQRRTGMGGKDILPRRSRARGGGIATQSPKKRILCH